MKKDSLKAPFFIVGCPRSGTTLLQLILDAHPNIAIPPESHIFERYGQIFDSYGDLKIPSNLETFVKEILSDKIIQQWKLSVSVEEFIDQLKETSVRGVVSLLFELFARKEGKKRWGCKTPQHSFYLSEIKEYFPTALIIHLVRDGRDVAESLSRVYIGPQSIYSIAHRWRQYVLAFHQFKHRLHADHYLEVKYEKLVGNPEKEIKRIFSFIGAEYDENILDNEFTARKNFYLQMAPHFKTLNKSISTKRIGVFQDRFSSREIEIFETIAGDAMDIYGYSKETQAQAQVRPTEKIRFLFLDYYLRYQRKLVRKDLLNQSHRELLEIVQYKIRKFKSIVRNGKRNMISWLAQRNKSLNNILYLCSPLFIFVQTIEVVG